MRRLTIIYSRLGSCTTGKKIPFERVMTHISAPSDSYLSKNAQFSLDIGSLSIDDTLTPSKAPIPYASVSRIFLSIIRFFCYYPLVVERDPRNREIQLEDLGNSYMECEA